MSGYQPSAEEIDYLGTVYAKSFHSNVIINSISLGIQLFMVLYSLSLFLSSSKERRKGRTRFIAISLIIWLAVALVVVLESWVDFDMLWGAGASGDGWISTYQELYYRPWFLITRDLLILVPVTIGDSLMVWRCFVLWQDKKWVTFLPILTCFSFTVIAIADASTSPFKSEKLGGQLFISWIILSVSTNVIVTTLIVVRMLRARQRLTKAMPSAPEMPQVYTDTMAILVESAAPLAFFGVCMVASTFAEVYAYPKATLPVQARAKIFDVVVVTLYFCFSSLSPQMIIFRVATGRSWRDAKESRDGSAGLSQPLEFAPRQMRSEHSLNGSTDVDTTQDGSYVSSSSGGGGGRKGAS